MTREFKSQEIARLRRWLVFLKENEPKYLGAVIDTILNTNHWPSDFHICPACGWLVSKEKRICANCEAENEDYHDEVIEKATPNRGY